MPMNKKERESYELMQLEVTLHKAMFVSDLIEPDVPPPSVGEPMTTGWTYNEHSMRILPACSSSIGHGLDQTDKTTSQHPLALYSSQKLAYKALRGVLSRRYATSLLIIDKKIARNEVNTD